MGEASALGETTRDTKLPRLDVDFSVHPVHILISIFEMFTLFLILGFYCPNLFFNFSFVTSHSFVNGNNLNFNDLCKNHSAVFCS